MSHMVADTDEELHSMAQRLGLRHSHRANCGILHYDLCQEKRVQAIKLGAQILDRRGMVNFMHRCPSG